MSKVIKLKLKVGAQLIGATPKASSTSAYRVSRLRKIPGSSRNRGVSKVVIKLKLKVGALLIRVLTIRRAIAKACFISSYRFNRRRNRGEFK